jgi:folate-binding protein YgfZ
VPSADESFSFAPRAPSAMTNRALRIRDYVGTIVGACATGGLLLAFWLAFLFQSLEKRAVSFSKGCYLGQEVVCMLEMRGHVVATLAADLYQII